MHNKYRVLAVAAMCIVCLLVTLPQTQKEPYAPIIAAGTLGPYELDGKYVIDYRLRNYDGKPLVINGKNGLMYGEIRRHTEDGSPDYNERQLFIYNSTGSEVTLEDGEEYVIHIDVSDLLPGTYSCDFVTTIGGTHSTHKRTFQIKPDPKDDISQMQTKEAMP